MHPRSVFDIAIVIVPAAVTVVVAIACVVVVVAVALLLLYVCNWRWLVANFQHFYSIEYLSSNSRSRVILREFTIIFSYDNFWLAATTIADAKTYRQSNLHSQVKETTERSCVRTSRQAKCLFLFLYTNMVCFEEVLKTLDLEKVEEGAI